MFPHSIFWLLDTSLRVSLIILLFLGVRPLLRHWIGSRAVSWLWLAIVARLLLPLPIPAPWSVPPLLNDTQAVVLPTVHLRVFVDPVEAASTTRVAASSDKRVPQKLNSKWDALLALWALGALLSAARLVRGWWIIGRWSARTLPGNVQPGLHAAYLALPTELRRGVGLRFTDALDVPTLVGVFRPQIWLPRTLPDRLTPAELNHVLLHELGHARRHDLLAQLLCALACCLHWFNPLVWLLARVARTDRELACDAWVLSHGTAALETPASYGHTLLKVVAGMSSRPERTLAAISMAAGRRHLGLRVREILAFRPLAPWREVSALAVVAVCVVIGTSGGRIAKADTGVGPAPSPAPSSPPSPVVFAYPTPAQATSPAPAGARPRQVLIESKFIEVSKASALQLLQITSPSSPLGRIFQQIFAPLAAPEPADPTKAPSIFRSALIQPDDFQALVRQLNQLKGIDLLSAPRVTTKSGQKATIEIIREFIYPTAFQRDKDPAGAPVTTPTNFDKKNTGVTVEATPTVEPAGDAIDLAVSWKITRFDGFMDADGKPVADGENVPRITFPTFDTHEVSTVATFSSGATVVYGQNVEPLYFRKNLGFAVGKTGPEDSLVRDDRVLLVFVTATLVNPEPSLPGGTNGNAQAQNATQPSPQPTESPAGSPENKPAPEPAVADLPYGFPVPNKPGMVISPYAPKAGYVDLSGIEPGTPVRDPYTSKMFLAP